MSDDILARLREMAGTVEPKADPKPKSAPKAAKPKADTFVPTPIEPEQITGVPVAVVEPVEVPSPATGILTPVVVLDDGSTFSNLRGAKVCWVQPDADEITDADLNAGIEISDLLTVMNAIRTMVMMAGVTVPS